MIPKVIHYCWFGNNPLPSDVKECIESWKKFCPDYEIKQWNEHNFDISNHPFMKGAFEAKKWAFVSDYARLNIIYENGGIYLDTDVEIIKSLDFLLDKGCYVSVAQVGHYISTGLGFGAEPNHPMVKAMRGQYDALEFNTDNMEKLLCPLLTTAAFEQIGFSYQNAIQNINGAFVYPPKYFDPLSPGDAENLMCSDTVSIHHYSATWTKKSQRWKRKLIRLIGEENVLRLKKWIKQ